MNPATITQPIGAAAEATGTRNRDNKIMDAIRFGFDRNSEAGQRAQAESERLAAASGREPAGSGVLVSLADLMGKRTSLTAGVATGDELISTEHLDQLYAHTLYPKQFSER